MTRPRLDESDLLALIEETCSAEEAVQLRERLDADPAARRWIESMRADRAAIRGLVVPEPPRDLLEGLEEHLARPMLYEARPGATRRRYQRHGAWPRRLVPLAVAAAVLGGLSVATWYAWREFARPLDRDRPGVSEAIVARPDDGDRERPIVDSSWPPLGAVVVHAPPAPGPPMAPATLASSSIETATDPSPVVSAPFSLRCRGASFAVGEAALVAAIGEIAPEGALVRNFTEAEARSLLDAHLEPLLRGGHERLPDAVAALSGAATGDSDSAREWRRTVDRAMRAVRAGAPEQEATPFRSHRILGTAEEAAPYDEQLRLSALGATHTATLPASRVAVLLAALGDEAETRIAALDAGTELPAGLAAWAREIAVARAFLEGLPEEAPVHLPIVIIDR